MAEYRTLIFPLVAPGGPESAGRVLTSVGDGTVNWQNLSGAGPAGPPGPTGATGATGATGDTGAGLKSFRAAGTTDGSGNATFNLAPAAFAATPIVNVAYQGTASSSPVDLRITALSATSCTVQARQSTAISVPLVGLTLLQQSAVLSGATVHLIAMPSGSQV